MFTLNDPKLTKQEEVFLLALQTDSELKKEVEKEKAKGNTFCFPSYWVVNNEDLIKLNRAAHQIDTCFDFDKEGLEQIFPHYENLLFEGERVEIGEWDKTYERWSSHSYQRVGVVFLKGLFESFEEEGFRIRSMKPEAEDEEELAIQYPFSFGKWSMGYTSFGLIDIPLHCLDEYEDRRVYERHYFLNQDYKDTKSKFLKDKEDWVKSHRSKKKKSTNPLVKKLRQKKHKGGFGQ